MSNSINTIIFDWAGVFCTPGEPFSHPIFREATGLGPDDVGAKVADIQDLYYRGRISPAEFWERIIAYFGLSGVTKDDLRQAYLDSYRLHPDMLPMAAKLTTAYPTVLLSNLTEEMMHAIEERHRASEHFQNAIFSNQVGFVKPEKEIFDLALAATGSLPDQTIFIDDSRRNVEAANQLGFKTILFTTPEHCVESLKELGIRLPS
ncbi:HAD family phosphatase [Candidatus Uhrbacteria bacterium]|nr:HAD family phosphatase [Candidatus Uhrbacteria bacterium]